MDKLINEKHHFSIFVDTEYLTDVPGALNRYFKMWRHQNGRKGIWNAWLETTADNSYRIRQDAQRSGYGFEFSKNTDF